MEKKLIVFQDARSVYPPEVAFVQYESNEEFHKKIKLYCAELNKNYFNSKYFGMPINYEIPTI